jgi:hypothetical protein
VPKYYTGIGSRETPQDILELMEWVAHRLYVMGYTLRSGGAPGADQAFERGLSEADEDRDKIQAHAEIYLPWKSFEADSRTWIKPKREFPQEEAYELGKKYHPGWKFLTYGAMKLHARNIHQILGYDVTNPEPSEFLVCWTAGGTGGGGTGQAIRVADDFIIPIFDLANEEDMTLLVDTMLLPTIGE